MPLNGRARLQRLVDHCRREIALLERGDAAAGRRTLWLNLGAVAALFLVCFAIVWLTAR